MRRPRGGAHARPARPGNWRGFSRDLGRRLHRHGIVRSAAGCSQGQRQAPDPALGRHRGTRYPEQRRRRRPGKRHGYRAERSVGLEGHDRGDAGRSRFAESAVHRVRWPGARRRKTLSAERQHFRRRRDRRHRPRQDSRGDRGRSHHHHPHRRAGSPRRLRPLHLHGRRGRQRRKQKNRQAGRHGDGEVGATVGVDPGGRRRIRGNVQWKNSTM